MQNPNPFSFFIEYTPLPVAVFDAEMRYINVSDRWLEMYNFTRGELVGRCHYDVVPQLKNMPHWLEVHARCLAGATEQRDADPMVGPEGQLEWISWAIRPWYKKDGTVGGIVMFAEIVSERKHTEMQLQQAANQLRELTTIIAHDVRAPLATLKLLIQLFSETDVIEEKNILSEKANKTIDGAMGILEGVMKALSIGTDNPYYEELSFESIFALVSQSLVQEIMESGVIVTTDFKKCPKVQYPKECLKNIFSTLLSNAIRFRSPKRSLEIHIESNKEDNLFFLSITDNGLGIDLERYSHKIFNFGQIFHNHKDAKGIGLYLIRKQIESMGGSISVESQVGVGSSFKVSFYDPYYEY